MTDCKALNERIKTSGLKKGHIAKSIGVSRQSLNTKLQGEREFKLDEVTLICKLLNISTEERENIFFA